MDGWRTGQVPTRLHWQTSLLVSVACLLSCVQIKSDFQFARRCTLFENGERADHFLVVCVAKFDMRGEGEGEWYGKGTMNAFFWEGSSVEID